MTTFSELFAIFLINLEPWFFIIVTPILALSAVLFVWVLIKARKRKKEKDQEKERETHNG